MSGEVLRQSPEYALQEFEGTYIGLTPTDESAINMGEIEITIDSQAVIHRWATGIGVQTEAYDIQQVKELTAQEVTDLFAAVGDVPSGQRVFNVQGLMFIFEPDSEAPEMAALGVVGGIGDFIAPTFLCSPAQIDQGLHEKLFQEFEEAMGAVGALPRLSNDGRAIAR